MAVAVARRYAAEGAMLALAARRDDELDILSADLRLRGAAKVAPFRLDLSAAEPADALAAMAEALAGVDVVLIAYGVLGDQGRAETDLNLAAQQLQTNFTSAALWALAAANILETQGHGVLIVIGSVAGDRGRRSNYLYGAAKAGLAALIQGIAHRLASSGARAVLVKPGFVDTPMTAHLPKRGLLWTKPEAIARVIRRAADAGGPVVYAPWFWRIILLALRITPSRLLHRTRL